MIRLGRVVPPTADGCAYQLREPHWLWLYDERVATPVPLPPPKTFRARLRAFILGEEAEKAMCQVCGYEPADDRSADLVDGNG